MGEWYLWLKVVHVLAVVAWMAGLFYLPRLFVYHASTQVGLEASELFKVMEYRLLSAIMRPAMVVAIVFGVLSGIAGGWFAGGQAWVWWKSALVAALVVFHGVLERHTGEFRRDLRVRPANYFRVINEVPTLLLIGIVILVVVKPF